MGKAHLTDIAALENTELAAVCVMQRDIADQYSAETNTPAYNDYRELLEREPLDAVLVAVPHYDHPRSASPRCAKTSTYWWKNLLLSMSKTRAK